MFVNAADRPRKQSASARDAPRSVIASRTAVKWPSAAVRSVASCCRAQGSTWRIVASSASSQRALLAHTLAIASELSGLAR
jgi:hypothetical protein